MPIFEIFSKRQKRLRGEVPDMYQYDTIPPQLRVQIIYIWEDAYGPYNPIYGSSTVYEGIYNKLCRAYGEANLSGQDDSPVEEVYNFFQDTKDIEKVVDVIEISFRYIDKYVRNNAAQFYGRRISPDEAIDQLNHRFQEHGVGYQYESGKIIRVDSQWIHSEVVKPALSMLSDSMYKGANEEFLKAHEHYRTQRYKECMNECLKAFESCIKAICTKRRWAYNKTGTINHLIGIVFDQGLIPTFMQSHFSGLRSTLEAGVPTARNRQSGHGQGANIIAVPEYMAAYALHLTASNILFLAKADDEMK